MKSNLSKYLENKKGFLIDINGTLYFKRKAIDRSIQTISKLKNLGYNLLFLTNTDSKTRKSIFYTLKDFGFEIEEHEIFTPIIALKNFLKDHPTKSIFLVSTKEIKEEFVDFNLITIEDDKIPDFIVLADFRDDWDVKRLNKVFQYIKKGSKLLGSQGNLYFLDGKGNPTLDTGSFVNLLVNVTNIEPRIFGKPSKDYFLSALKILNFNPKEVCIIGDDFHSDILGAEKVGIGGILVETGKGMHLNLEKEKKKPDFVLKSISEILNFI